MGADLGTRFVGSVFAPGILFPHAVDFRVRSGDRDDENSPSPSYNEVRLGAVKVNIREATTKEVMDLSREDCVVSHVVMTKTDVSTVSQDDRVRYHDLTRGKVRWFEVTGVIDSVNQGLVWLVSCRELRANEV